MLPSCGVACTPGAPEVYANPPMCGVPCTPGVPEVYASPPPSCGVPCTPGAPGGYACPLPISISPPMAAPYRGDQGGMPLLRSSSFSATGGGVIGAGTFGNQAGVLPCIGAL